MPLSTLRKHNFEWQNGILSQFLIQALIVGNYFQLSTLNNATINIFKVKLILKKKKEHSLSLQNVKKRKKGPTF